MRGKYLVFKVREGLREALYKCIAETGKWQGGFVTWRGGRYLWRIFSQSLRHCAGGLSSERISIQFKYHILEAERREKRKHEILS